MTDQFRPDSWESYIGQDKLKRTLQLALKGCVERQERLDHILLNGPPGAGKTSLAFIIADDIGVDFEETIAPIKPATFRRLISSHSGILFIDEIHRMSPKEQETLLPLLEDQRFITDYGFIDNPDLTIVAATTERKKIIKPLWDRFTIKPAFEAYSDDEMGQIVQSMGRKVGIEIPKDMALKLGAACAGIPRQAKAMVRMAQNLGTVSASKILKELRMTEDGLDPSHISYLKTLVNAGGTAGMDVLSSHTDMSKEVIQDIEKLLVSRQYIELAKTGRTARPRTYTLMKELKTNGY